jgi:hypothetical protein
VAESDAPSRDGQAVGNLQALKRLHMSTHDYHEDDEVVPIIDWEILACILSHVRQKVRVYFDPHALWAVEEVQAFARRPSSGYSFEFDFTAS